MASIKTDITEIMTGLGMLGYDSLERALSVRPRAMTHVEERHFDRLAEAWDAGKYRSEFLTAWTNGWAFARSEDGLRGRPPWRLEWKGPHKPPDYEQIPADLRIDHVYLISCKYGSTILHNVSPAHLFDRALSERRTERNSDWFVEVASEAFQEFYDACRDVVDRNDLPPSVRDLDSEHRGILKGALPKRARLPDVAQHSYESFVYAVSRFSAERWQQQLRERRQREAMLWRLIRLQAAPYFVLGAAGNGEPLRYRVGTPWDFRERFEFLTFDVWPDKAGQPLVRWRGEVKDRSDGRTRVIEGHVEIRWTHGRFSGAPEAKVHLDTDPHSVAGYFPLSTVIEPEA